VISEIDREKYKLYVNTLRGTQKERARKGEGERKRERQREREREFCNVFN